MEGPYNSRGCGDMGTSEGIRKGEGREGYFKKKP